MMMESPRGLFAAKCFTRLSKYSRIALVNAISWAMLSGNPAASAQVRLPTASSQPQVSISIDARRNEAYIKADDAGFESFVYSAERHGNVITVQPASKELMAIWKGGAELTPGIGFEEKDQFAPAFLVADVRNDTPLPINVTNAYLDVAESTTDYHPYLVISEQECSDGSYHPELAIQDFGWGAVIQPKLTYTFAAKGVRSRPFDATFPTFRGALGATVEGGLKQAGANIAAMKRGNYRCPAASEVPSCFARLKQSRLFGDLANNVYVGEDNILYSDVSGTIDYTWADSRGVNNKSSAPFKIQIPLGKFAVGGPECGGAGPIDRSEHPIILPLDRQHYRIPLNWHTQMLSRQEQKFSLSLASPKSSNHTFRIVLQLSDGRTINSPVIDLTYFTPRMN